MITSADQIESSQIKTLQLEVVALRRRLGMLSEQNDNYSRRLAALENQPAILSTNFPSKSAPEPIPGTPVEGQDQETASKAAKPPVPLKRPAVTAAAKSTKQPTEMMRTIDTVPAPETGIGPLTSASAKGAPKQQKKQYEPVRIVAASNAMDDEITTSSINESAIPKEEPEPKPLMIMPSKPAGKATGSGKSAIGRSDFGAVVGRYDTKELAAAAWQAFKEENSERMQDMLPVVAPSQLQPGKVDLLIGPFANAADAMVACLRLLDISETCHPAFFVGEDADKLVASLTPGN
ncbi:hypothetical protein [Roseibium algae]|uniref:SPOR domain-containing protein n=1 Tax=Roseibium algae TaxID=3123038 RepID=A0ABU8TN51_9HYPH